MRSIAECRDCMEAMREFPDKYFDLAVVDPPYGIHQHGGTNKTRSRLAKAKDYKPFAGMDKEPPSDKYFEQLMRVSKNQVIWGANHFLSRLGARDAHCWLVWNKDNSDSNFADCELAWTSFDSAVRMFTFRWQGMLQGNMANKEERIHPTQKPVALYSWILGKYAKRGTKSLIPIWGAVALESPPMIWGWTSGAMRSTGNTLPFRRSDLPGMRRSGVCLIRPRRTRVSR